MKKTVLLLMVLVISLSALVSCGDREYDEAEVSSAAKELIEDSIMLNEVYYGKGILYSDDLNLSDGVYREAIYAYHSGLGFTTVDQLKRITKNTFSEGLSESMFSTVLSGINDGKDTLLARYYQKYSVLDGKTPEAIMVNSNWSPIFTSEVEYDFDSVKAIGSEGETVFVTIDCTVSKTGYEDQKVTLQISLVEEEKGWRIDSPTFLNYDVTKVK